MTALAKSAVISALLLVLSKILGLARDLCIAYRFGTSYIVDAYSSALGLPSVLFSIFASGLLGAFVPVYTRIESHEERKSFFDNTMTIFIVVSVFVTALCFPFSDALSDMLGPRYDRQTHELLTQFVRLILPTFPLLTVYNLISARMQTHEDFIFSNFCDYVVVNVVLIVSILIASDRNPAPLAAGYTGAYLMTTGLIWLYAAKRYQLRYSPRIKWNDPQFITLCKLAVPLGASALISDLNGLIDRMFSSGLGEGATSALSYANKLQLLFFSLTTAVLLSVCFPRVSRRFAEHDTEEGLFYIRQAFVLAMYLSVPFMGGLLLYAAPLITFLFEHGRFTAESTSATSVCLVCYALGIPFYALRSIGMSTLSAAMEQKLILKNTALTVLCNVTLNFMLVRFLGATGLALATSISGLLGAVFVLLDLRRLDMRVILRRQFPELAKILLGSVIALLISYLSYRGFLALGAGRWSVILAALVAIAVYLVFSIVCRLDIFVWLYEQLPEKLRVIRSLHSDNTKH